MHKQVVDEYSPEIHYLIGLSGQSTVLPTVN